MTELKETAKHILEAYLEENTTLRWPEGSKEKIGQLEVLEQYTEDGEGGEVQRRKKVFTDGSRLDGQTAAATITNATFLGRYATVMDAEMLAIAMGWELGDTVITDSQASIGRVQSLQLERPRGWIEERVVAAAREGEKKIGWVKEHSGVLGNEPADLRAEKEAWMGVRRGDKDLATAGGISHEFMAHKTGTGMGQRRTERAHLHLYR